MLANHERIAIGLPQTEAFLLVLFLEVRTYGLSRNGRTREGMIADRSARFQKTLLKLIEPLHAARQS
jgi:hypothetical protein